MGTCQCQKNNNLTKGELNNFFTRNYNENNNNINNDQINIINNENNQEQENNNKYSKFKDIGNLIKIRTINNFISKNLNRLYKKDKYNKLKSEAKNLFFEKIENNFEYDQIHFERLFDSKLSKFIDKKGIVIKDLSVENFGKSLYKFNKLKEVLNKEINNYILKYHKDFADEVMLYGIKNDIITKEMIELNIKRTISKKYVKQRVTKKLKKNFTALQKNKTIKLIKKSSRRQDDNFNRSFKTTKSKNYSLHRKVEIIEEVKNNSFEKDKNNLEKKEEFQLAEEKVSIENIIRKELDKFFDFCFNNKQTESEFQKSSIFLKFITSEKQEKTLNPKLTNIINSLYYIYLLKKYNFLSDTKNCFYQINSVLIRKKSILRNKSLLIKKGSIFKKENTLNLKILKNLFNYHNEEPELSESLSSISSDEAKKECHSLVSTINDIPFLKELIKKENDKSDKNINNINDNTNNNNINRINEEKTADIKNENNQSFHIEKIDNLEKDKYSFIKNSKMVTRIRTQRKKSEDLYHTEYYNGNYDNTIYLYAGEGVLINQDLNNLYHGTFRYGKKEGMGFMYKIKNENNMEYFMGEFHQNKIYGFGTKILINNNELIYLKGIFDGEYLINGKYKKMILDENENNIKTFVYKGDLINNKFSGKGNLMERTYNLDPKTLTYELIQIIDYTGEFSENKKNGKGEEILKNRKYKRRNYKYEGNFCNDLKDGYGKIIYDENSFVHKYEGFFEKDKPLQSYGIIQFKSGDIYEGFLNNSLKDYVGLYQFIDPKSKKFNEVYFGGFTEDYKDGIGKNISEDSGTVKMLRGNYKKGDKEGQFIKVVYKEEEISIKKMRRYDIKMDTQNYDINDVINYNKSPKKSNYKKIIKLQTKTFPIYEENEMIDANDNFLYD